ncbi:F-box/LRR-repeat protein At3g58900-like, partial [Neltuma alba]|uniref:F-box/LRR-repeat protein At3g58900-like n=1 Tax=Neltuma alba TaxID=207710 RepID=UPI0010A4D2A9
MGEEVILKDRISNLPDSLLYHILSFLSTKEASAISLLSKRWNSVWLSQPTLDFDDESFSTLLSFVQFVDSGLKLRGGRVGNISSVDLPSLKALHLEN